MRHAVHPGDRHTQTSCSNKRCSARLIDAMSGTVECANGHRIPLVDLLALAAHRDLFKGSELVRHIGPVGIITLAINDPAFKVAPNPTTQVRCGDVIGSCCDDLVIVEGKLSHVCTDNTITLAPLLPLVRLHLSQRKTDVCCKFLFDVSRKIAGHATKEQSDMDKAAHSANRGVPPQMRFRPGAPPPLEGFAL